MPLLSKNEVGEEIYFIYILFFILSLNSVIRSGSPYETQISEKVAHTTTDDAKKWISKIITLFHLDTDASYKMEYLHIKCRRGPLL